MIERRIRDYSKRSLFNLILYTLFFLAFLFGLIGFNFLLLYSATDFVLGFLIELGKIFALPINFFLSFMLIGLSIPFILAWRKYILYISPKNKIKFFIPEVEQKILQALAEHKGAPLSRLVIVRKVNFPGTMKEFTDILNKLWEEGKIKREFKEYPRYSAV